MRADVDAVDRRKSRLKRALDVVGDVPVLLIMEQAFLGTHGFDEFVARTGLARSVVSGRLRKLVDEDCLAKRPKKEGRGSYYALTQKGREVFEAAIKAYNPRVEALANSLPIEDIQTAHRVVAALRDKLEGEIDAEKHP